MNAAVAVESFHAKLVTPILADAAAIATLRRDIHANPELCFESSAPLI